MTPPQTTDRGAMFADPQQQDLIDDLKAGEPTAVDRLIEHSCERLRKMTRRLLRSSPSSRRAQETDDAFQCALIRLRRSLNDVELGKPKACFVQAAAEIRRELTGLARHYYDQEGGAAHAASDTDFVDDGRTVGLEGNTEDTARPATLLQWAEIHEQVGKLPVREREVFDLLFYQGLWQENATTVLDVGVRTVKSRWRSAKLRLDEALEGMRRGLR